MGRNIALREDFDGRVCDDWPRRRRMTDRPFLRLSLRWRLASGGMQWILQHYRPPGWRSVAFVASNKVVLRRVLREAGAEVTPTAQTTLNRLPKTFAAWREQQRTCGREAA